MTNEDRADYGLHAVRAGTPDYGQNDRPTDAADAIANVLHHLHSTGLSIGECGEVLTTAFDHFNNEPPEPSAHTGHYTRGGTHYCDTCDSPYCDEA